MRLDRSIFCGEKAKLRKDERKINFYHKFAKNDYYAILLMAPPREMLLKAPAFRTSHFFCLSGEGFPDILRVSCFMIGNDVADFFNSHDAQTAMTTLFLPIFTI